MFMFVKKAAATLVNASAGKLWLFLDSDGLFKTKDETGVVSTIGGVSNFNGRNGNVVPQQADYDQFFTTTSEAAAAAPVQSVNTKTGAVTLSTSDIGEGTNLYYTNGRASAAAPVQSVAGKTGAVTLDTSNVSENAANLYYTNARASAAAPVQSVFGRSGAVVAQQADYDAFFTTPAEAAAAAPVQSVAGRTGAVTLSTTDVAEGTNLYYTDVRARASTLAARLATAFNSTANSAAAQTVLTLVVPAARITAGMTLEFELWGVQTSAATNGGNNNVIVTLNGTAVATATVATGATAQTNRPWNAIGAVSFQSTTLVYASALNTISGVLGVAASNGAAGTTVAAGDVTIAVQVQTATANAGNTIKVVTAYLSEV